MIRHLHVVHQSDPGCLARLKAQRDGADATGEPAKIGTACHRAAEALADLAADDDDDRPESAVVALAIRDAAPELDMAPESVGEALQIMERAIASVIPLHLTPEPDAACYSEMHWRLDRRFKPLPEDASPGDIAFAGTFDRVEVFADRVVVTDWKTVREKMAGWELPDNWQARVYSLAALQFWPGARRVTYRWVNLRHCYALSHDFERGATWEAATRTLLGYAADRRTAAMASDEWPETMGEDCGWCPVLHRCRAVADAVEQGAEVTNLPPAEIARRWLGVRALAGRLERTIKPMVAALGHPLDMGDGSVLGGKPVQAWDVVLRYEDMMNALTAFGMTRAQEIEWFRHCAANHYPSRVKRALNELLGREARAAIESDEYITPVTNEQFAVWTPDPSPEEPDVPAFDVLGGG